MASILTTLDVVLHEVYKVTAVFYKDLSKCFTIAFLDICQKFSTAKVDQVLQCVFTRPCFATRSLFAKANLTIHYIMSMSNGNPVDGERFAGLNAHIFNPNEVFTEIFSHCLGQKCLFSIIKESTYIHGKSFAVLLRTVKNVNV